MGKAEVKYISLNELMKDPFNFTVQVNVDLRLSYIPSGDNPAYPLSRSLSAQDSTLNREMFRRIDQQFSPHQVALMSLDSNVMQDENGYPLPHFTPYPTPASAGVNVFAQELCPTDTYYIFPPFGLILPVLHFIMGQKVKFCTMIVPFEDVKPVWWPVLCRVLVDHMVIGKRGDLNVLLIPSKNGFRRGKYGLKHDM